MEYDRHFWDQRYEEGDTPWDIGDVSPPIKEYIDQLTNKEISILIPGCGNAHEAEYLHRNGFTNVCVLDISPVILRFFHQRVPEFPEDHLLNDDYFKHDGEYDLIIEQTFFCAIHPTWRDHYAEKAASLLKPGGKLIGVLFDDELNIDKPPFGGAREDYMKVFEPYFKIRTMEHAFNSIKPRMERELFINLSKK